MTTKRIHYLSFASVISAMAVVLLHTNGCFWIFSQERYWLTANIIESVMYFAVPVFFMISGATLLEYQSRYSTKEFFIKRAEKTLLPFLIWSVVGVIYAAINGYYSLSTGTNILLSFADTIIHTKAVGIYWFFIPLFRIYLLIPLLAYVKEKRGERGLIFILVANLVWDFFLCNVFITPEMTRTEIDKNGWYLTYVIAGYFIHKYEIPIRLKKVIYVIGLFGLLLHIGGTYVLSMNAGTIVQTFKGYANIPCILYSIAIFVLFKDIGSRIQNEKVISCIEYLSQYTFAIYLLHWFVMEELKKLFHLPIFSIYYRIGMPVIIFILCIFITWFIRKIPVLRKLLP